MVPRLFKAAAAAAGCLLLASTVFAQSPFIRNDIKYRDSGSRPATGRSGSATIEARALIGRDGVTTIEISSNGTLEKVQVKHAGASEALNFTGLDGNAFSTALTGLAPGEAVLVQANVGGVDGARVDVVTAETTVARRPDLSVASVTAAPHGVADTPVRITATIRELNGETGARANCVLSVAGMDVDRADNIWIDAGDSVTCMFATTFATAGDKDFTVRVENVQPGDDDDSNHSAGGSMQIYASASEFTFASVSIHQSQFTSHTKVTAWWGGSETTEHGINSDSVIYTYIADQNADVPNLTISTRETTDGELIHESNGVELEIRPGQWVGEPTCGFAFKDFQLYMMCDIPFAFRQPRSFWMEVWRMASAATYHSTGWNLTMPTDTPPGYYTWNENFSYHYGSQKRLGSTYEWQLTISNGTRLWETRGVLPLTNSTNTYGPSRYCFAGSGGQQCVETTHTSISKQGFATTFGD